MALVFRIKQNDTRPVLAATLLNADGSAYDLTGVTGVNFIMNLPGLSAAPKVDSAAVVTDATAGQVEYRWAAVDTDTAADYEGEFEVDIDGTEVLTFPTKSYIKIIVVPDKG